MKRFTFWIMLAAAHAAGCYGSNNTPTPGDTNTHWLRACTSDSNCRGDQRCIGEVCTIECEDERRTVRSSVCGAVPRPGDTRPAILPCGDDGA